MALLHKYTIICDDVRREDNGKLIVLGMFMGTIGVPQLPTTLSTLTVLLVFDADRTENLPFTLKIKSLESGKQLAEAQGFANIPQPGPGVMPVKFGNVRIDSAGAYSIETEIRGISEPLVTSFAVVLTPQIGGQMIPRTTS